MAANSQGPPHHALQVHALGNTLNRLTAAKETAQPEASISPSHGWWLFHSMSNVERLAAAIRNAFETPALAFPLPNVVAISKSPSLSEKERLFLGEAEAGLPL